MPIDAYTPILEIDSPDLLTSETWARAVDSGCWPEVRPFTNNRRWVLTRKI